MSENSPETIVSFLKHNEIKNMNMLYFMENNPVCSFERTGDSVVLRGESDHPWVYISSPDEQELTVAIKTLTSNDKFFAVIEDWMLPALTADKTLLWQLSTMKLVLPEDVTFPQKPESHITPLSAGDAQYLYDHSLYQGVTSSDYIRNRIQNGLSAGIFESGKLVAWALTHDDSAIGFLHVLPVCRRKGYAYELTVYLISKLRKQGKIPFVQIEEANLKSIHLATKLGFRKDRRVHWFEVQQDKKYSSA
ncbi:MAG: GNAT family N-acetyltransferase [Candidatus Sabulitectum sp.]|nr:GNAT family N-acetyltransferase [Candidatus Sabulitectum sp.]